MIIAVGSDLHLDHGGFKVINHLEADVLILAGDIFVGSMLVPKYKAFFDSCCAEFKHVIYVTGNHEYYTDVFGRHSKAHNSLKEYSTIQPNFHWLQNTGVTIDGQKFYGCTLWTDQFGGSERYMQQSEGFSDFWAIKGFEVQDAVNQHNLSRKLMYYQFLDNTVVITHHAPSILSVAPRWTGNIGNSNFYSNMDEFIKETKPKMWIHGHMHDASDYRLGDTRVICNPRGYPAEREWEWDFKYYEI